MTNDAPEAAETAAQPEEQWDGLHEEPWADQPAAQPDQTRITLSAVAEELAAEAEWHRNRKLMRAGHVDELRIQLAAAQAQNAELAEKLGELAAAVAAGMEGDGMEGDDGAE